MGLYYCEQMLNSATSLGVFLPQRCPPYPAPMWNTLKAAAEAPLKKSQGFIRKIVTNIVLLLPLLLLLIIIMN